MRRFSFIVTLLSATMMCGCLPSKVNMAVLNTLADYEGAKYELVEERWEGEGDIARTPTTSLAGKDLLMQLEQLYYYVQLENGIEFSRASSVNEPNEYYGNIEIGVPVQSYDTGEKASRPSDVAKAFLFNSYFFQIPYQVHGDGELTVGRYQAAAGASDLDERGYLSCSVEKFSYGEIILVFPNYLVPDFLTDSFKVGKVLMVFKRNQ